MKHANISIFVPHLGCPNDCSFCNQRFITGQSIAPTPEDVVNAVNTALNSPNYNHASTEIAFFGGSFTAIDKEYMLSLLSAAYVFVKNKKVKGIRISTRPDCIDEDILNVLKDYGVTSIELGAQSMVDSVLVANNRGHSSYDVVKASDLIRNKGFELGLQMMTGLYTDTDEGSVFTANKIIELMPDTVRIYPTIVLKNTKLAHLFESGEYIPQTISSAVNLCVTLSNLFADRGIKVIRTGLHAIDESAYVAGPWHPAFSELCETEKIYRELIHACNKLKEYVVRVNPSDISKAVGQKRSSLDRLKTEGYKITFVQDNNIEKNRILIKEVK